MIQLPELLSEQLCKAPYDFKFEEFIIAIDFLECSKNTSKSSHVYVTAY